MEGVKDVGFDEILVDLSFKNFVFVNEFLSLPMEGFEKEVKSLLRRLQVRKGLKVVGLRVNKRPSSASHVVKELQKLECTIH